MKNMMNLKAISLPAEFTRLLTCNMGGDSDIVMNVHQAFEYNPMLKTVMGQSFSFQNGGVDIGKMVKTLGWLHFRDRLSSIYLNKLHMGYYPYEIDSALINEILEIEHELSPYTVQGISRSYLLGFYLSVHNLHFPDKPMVIPSHVLEFLKQTRHKVERIDYLVLLLWQFSLYLGETRLEKLLMNEDHEYSSIYEALTLEQKERMSRNFLRYGFSINEMDIFEHKVV